MLKNINIRRENIVYMKVKTTNALMKYLRKNHNITISGSKDKKYLRNIGYYHGYKGYRYIKNPKNRVVLTNFNEIVSIVDFDTKLKSLLYSQIMQIETISKNYVLQILVEEYKTDNFNDVYEQGMTDYRKFKNDNEYKEKMKHRIKVQNNIYSSLSKCYNNGNKIVSHFYSKDRYVPLWGVFEIITLGIFADLIKSLELNVRLKIARQMNINKAYDTNALFPEKIMYLTRALRNSIAHNDVIFDVRFKDTNVAISLCKFLENEIGCQNIDFNTITDYIILISFLLKSYGIPKIEINRFINDFEKLTEEFRNKISINVYNQVIYTDNKQKLNALRNYIKK